MRAAVLTVSDGVHAGVRDDASGDLLETLLADEGFDVVRRIVPDESAAIEEAIGTLASEAELVLRPAAPASLREIARRRRRLQSSIAKLRVSPKRFARMPSPARRTPCSPAASPGCAEGLSS